MQEPQYKNGSLSATAALEQGRRGGGLLDDVSPTDRLLLLYLGGLCGLALLRHPDPHGVLALASLLAIAIVAVARWGRSSPIGQVVHDFFPIVGIIYVFELNGPVVGAVNSLRWDATFAALDAKLFGTLPAAWFSALGRPDWLTDAASLTYFLYYVIPFAMGVTLYAHGRKQEYRDFAFVITATFLVSYIGYYLMPTSGPRPLPHTEAELLGGGAVSHALRVFLHYAEVNRFDAFPSGHTTISLVFLALGWRLLPSWRIPLTLAVAAIIFATVYLSLHYVVDLVAGAIVAALMPWILPPLRLLVSPGTPDRQ